MAGERVGWSEDGNAAYLFNANGDVIARWIRGRPDISTFDPANYQLGGGQAAVGGGMWEAERLPPGAQGTYIQDPERLEFEEFVRQFDLTYDEATKIREENARQFDEDLQHRKWALEQEMAIAREQIASTEGMQRYDWEQKFRMAEQEHARTVELLQMDWRERHKLADKELAMRLREIQGKERITAAERWGRPIDYLVYNRWAAGQQAATTESGLPAGAPEFQTGLPAQAVGPGGVPTSDIYGERLAAGGRMAEFGAWGGPTTPVGGTPWIAPHKTNIAEFSRMPMQAQEMAYARWRQRGIMPETAQQTMTAAAPVGTAGGAIRYG